MKVKNSNKVLLVMLVLIIAVPLLVGQVLLHQIRTNNFVLENNMHTEDPALRSEGSLEGVKAVKLIGPLNRGVGPDLLTTSVLVNANHTYSIKKIEKMDSMTITRIADTLVFRYYVHPMSIDNPRYYYYNHISLILNLPENIPIYAQNSTIEFSSFRTDSTAGQQKSPQLVYLKEHSVLELGTEVLTYKMQPDTVVDVQHGKTFLIDTSKAAKDNFDSTFAQMGNFRVFANNSTVKVIQPLILQDLQMQLTKGSMLYMKYPIKTGRGELSGSLDADTQIIGDLSSVRSIETLLRR